MNLGGLDLNLTLALDALLREQNVTRAAERLNLTQPTVSASLARLRRHFDDELLRRNGNVLELTALAYRLRPLVADAVLSLQRTFDAHREFDPARSVRRFSLVTSDYGLHVAGLAWSASVSAVAPDIRMAFSTVAMPLLTPPDVRARDVDGILAPQGFLPDHLPHLDLFEDRWVLVADRYSAVSDRPSFEELRRMSWASAFEGPALVPSGVTRGEWATVLSRVSVVVDTFAAIPHCVQGTSRVALMQERLVDALGVRPLLRVIEPPLRAEPIRLAFWWHPAFESDAEHSWLRAHLRRLRTPSTSSPAA